MLAEIFFLQLEATQRADNEESKYVRKFVPFDWTTVPGFRWISTTAQGGRSTTE
jgi:hypothetical protein